MAQLKLKLDYIVYQVHKQLNIISEDSRAVCMDIRRMLASDFPNMTLMARNLIEWETLYSLQCWNVVVVAADE